MAMLRKLLVTSAGLHRDIVASNRPVERLKCFCGIGPGRRQNAPAYSSDSKSRGDEPNTSGRGKYTIFRDEEAPVILDVEEQRNLLNLEKADAPVPVAPHKFEGLNLERGKNGVFEIEELVEVLKREKAEDVCVLRIPADLKYVEYLVVATGKSQRQILGIAEFVRRVYKEKRHRSDTVPTIEGANTHWIAMDLGNIALHIMSSSVREKYDLEGLWSLGPEYDLKASQPEDELMELLKKHAISLDDFLPADKLG